VGYISLLILLWLGGRLHLGQSQLAIFGAAVVCGASCFPNGTVGVPDTYQGEVSIDRIESILMVTPIQDSSKTIELREQVKVN